jgi:hypothetical protein
MSSFNKLASFTLVCLLHGACGTPHECEGGTKKAGTRCVDVTAVDEQATAADASSDGAPSSTDAAHGDAEPGEACEPGTRVYADDDGDGVGAGESMAGCPAAGLVVRAGDCQPDDPSIFSGADELCNGFDDDCDGDTDEGTVTLLYIDVDGDGHGDANDPGETACAGETREGKVSSNDDCDDTCMHCVPGAAAEAMCDGRDDNCDGQIDEGLTHTFKLDCDGDGHVSGLPQEKVACAAPEPPSTCAAGTWRTSFPVQVDCDDSDAKKSPSLAELCDGIDNNCNGSADDGLSTKTYYPDCDNDKYPRAAGAQARCGTVAIASPICSRYIVARSDNKQDCGDDDDRAHPGAGALADKSGIKGGHATGSRQDFNCDGAVTMSPTLNACPSSGACLSQGPCRVGTLSCGAEGKLKSKKTVTGPMGIPLEICSEEAVTPTCK